MKDNIKGIQRQTEDWEKIITEGTTDKVLLPQIYKEPLSTISR